MKTEEPQVLVVENGRRDAATLLELVRELGFRASHAEDSAAAWRSLLQTPFSMVIIDWRLSGQEGVLLCRRIRSGIFRHYVFVTLTGCRDEPQCVETASEVADALLVDPIDVAELRMLLVAAERIFHLERRLRASNEELRDANARLLHSARMDPLMQIGNRLAFENKIREVHAAAAQSGRVYSVIMSDVDYFKCYNDTLGHQQGDQILRRIATAIKEAVRDADRVFRYGGEEVALLLIDQDEQAAARIAERVRSHVEALEFQGEELEMPFRVTVSCGVASYPASAGAEDDWRNVVEAADQALYIAKNSGRNRVALSGPELGILPHSRMLSPFLHPAFRGEPPLGLDSNERERVGAVPRPVQ